MPANVCLGNAGSLPEAAWRSLDEGWDSAGGDVPEHATYRNHGTHAEAIGIIFNPRENTPSPANSSSSSSRSADPDDAEPSRATTSGAGATARRSATSTIEQRRVAEDTIAAIELVGALAGEGGDGGDAGGAVSGRPSPSIRTTSSGTRTATPATSYGPDGFCPARSKQPPASQRPDQSSGGQSSWGPSSRSREGERSRAFDHSSPGPRLRKLLTRTGWTRSRSAPGDCTMTLVCARTADSTLISYRERGRGGGRMAEIHSAAQRYGRTAVSAHDRSW